MDAREPAPPRPPAGSRRLGLFFAAAALAYAAAGIAGMLFLSPRVPYADAWRHYARLLTEPFPASVLKAENGHPEIVANLVRFADLLWLRGDERWQIGAGVLLALAAFGVGLRIVLRAPAASFAGRSAAALALSLGVFWLGNARALAHDNEALHVYSVLLCLFLALAVLLRRDGSAPVRAGEVAAAGALCFLASFNFGSGMASFAALFALLGLRRARWRHFAIAAAWALLAFAGYRLLEGSARVPLRPQPLHDAVLALRWIATPLIYLFWPLVDPAAAAALPGPARAAAMAVARCWTQVFGDVRTAVFPHVLFGAAFLAGTTVATLRAGRRPHPDVIERFGLALAWFGLGVAGLIALSRADYFLANPTQVYAPRYLPWSSLAWAGLLMAIAGRESASGRGRAAAVAVSVLALAAEGGMSLAMRHQREVAEDVALAAVVGVWPDEHGEDAAADTRDGTRALRRVPAGPLAWPEAAWLGGGVPPGARERAGASVSVLPGGDDAQALRIEAAGVAGSCRRRLLAVEEGRVVGLLRPLGGGRWRGFARAGAGARLAIYEPACG